MCVPTLAFTGVPEMVVPEIVIVLGAPLIEYVSESPESTSVQTLATLKLYDASSAVEASDIALAIVGASLVLVTVRTYSSEADRVPVPSSVHVTVIVCVPTSALSGVPEMVVPEIVIVLGAPLIEYVSESPESTSVQTLATLKLYDASSAVETSDIALATVGASLTLDTDTEKVSVTEPPFPSLAVITTEWLPT